MTPETLLACLERLPADAPLVFQTGSGSIQGGYHVTELKLARIRSIDCSARRSQWDEAVLQLLDRQGGDHMTAGRFTAILAQSIRHVAELGPATLYVEFGHRNFGLRVLHPDEPRLEDDQVIIRLRDANAVCKPLLDAQQGSSVQTSSCEPTQTAARSCCA